MEDEPTKSIPPAPDAFGRLSPRVALIGAVLGAAIVGAGATALAERGRSVALVTLTPGPVADLKDGTMAAIKGDVAEIFGNKFVVGDTSGRALVETGRRGEGSTLVTKGEAVTVQGRFENGFLHAMAITHGDGHADMLDPPPPPRPPAPRGGPDDDGPARGPRPPL